LQIGPEIAPSEEWLGSEIAIPNNGAVGVTDEYLLHMVGVNTPGSKGIVDGYQDSRSFPQSPDPAELNPETSWFNLMHDVGMDSQEVVSNATDRNDELPYDQNEYPGAGTNFMELECQGYKLNQSTVGLNTFNTGPFTAPCGLIRIDILGTAQTEDTGDYNLITVELVPGNQRGYLTETMEEF